MGILQATSTRNDYVLAASMVCFVACALRFLRNPDAWLWGIGMSVALGLAILTKQTAFFYAPAFCVLVGLRTVTMTRWRSIGIGIGIAAIIVVLNAGFVTRTAQLYRPLLGPPPASQMSIAPSELRRRM